MRGTHFHPTTIRAATDTSVRAHFGDPDEARRDCGSVGGAEATLISAVVEPVCTPAAPCEWIISSGEDRGDVD